MLCRVLCALLFVAWTAEWPLAIDNVLYCGLWRSPFEVFGGLFVSVPGIGLFPWQIALFALAPVCLMRPGAFRRRAWPLDMAILISLGSIGVTFLWGWMRGGSAYNAYYQLWRFLVALLVALMLVSVIRTPRHLKALGTTIVLAALVRGTLVLYFYWAIVHGRIDPVPPYMTTHDDTLLFIAALLIVLSWALAQASAVSALLAGAVSLHLLYAIVLNNRRLAWVELLLVLALVYAVLPRSRMRRRVNRFLLFAAPVLVLYAAIGWGREGAVFAPVRALSTTGSNDDASSLARQEEIRNLLYTLTSAGNPILGTGWGVPYQKLTTVYANFSSAWWQYLYMPHNSLLGVCVFAGLVGLCGIWLVVPVTALLAMGGYREAAGPIERAAAMSAVCILPAYAAQCYGDLGFQSLTCGLILGVAMATGAKVSAWAAALGTDAKGTRPRARAPVPRRPAIAAAGMAVSP
jgi:hypothetical protein